MEERIRQQIRQTIEREYFYHSHNLNESYGVDVSPGEFSQIFLDPWKEAWQGSFAELKKVASQALTVTRLFFTLNQKKAKEIEARQKDRLKKFSAESDAAMEKLGGAPDLDLVTFVLNPAPWALGKIKDGAVGAVDFAKEIGIGDKSISTVKGDESEEDALIRRREQDGPVKKALRALEQIFFLAHAAPTGPLLSEGVVEDVEQEIMQGSLGQAIADQRELLFAESTELIELIETTAAQNMFLSTIARIETAKDPQAGLRQMDTAIKELTAADPEGAKAIQGFPQQMYKEAEQLAKDEKFRSELEKAKEDSGEEIDYGKEALLTVMGTAFADNIEAYLKSIAQNNELLDSAFQTIFGAKEIERDVADMIDSEVDGFVDSLRLAEKVLQRRLIS